MTEPTLSAPCPIPATDADNYAEHSSLPRLSTNYVCNACEISFQNGQEQRIHMKEPWHVLNVKRRVVSLPPVSLEKYDMQIEQETYLSEAYSTSGDSSSDSNGEHISDEEGEESGSPFRCLFCSHIYANDDAGFAENLEHMHTMHGMSIPHPEIVNDLQCFVGYLATQIRSWHECLHCGVTKGSTMSIQSHMKDKGHCLLNFERAPELLEFWESLEWVDRENTTTHEHVQPIHLSAAELRLACGKVIGTKDAARTAKKASRIQRLSALTREALPTTSEDAESSSLALTPQPAQGRQLAHREEMSILGVSVQQRQALVLAEKKAQRSDAVARHKREWVYAKGANSQKFDQVDNQMKWGKQNHKLLPR